MKKKVSDTFQNLVSRHSEKCLTPKRVAIGADHGGFALKAKLVAMLQGRGFEVADLGTHSAGPCDYPRIGYKVAAAVAEGRFDRGILLCKSGIGIAIVANKVRGIRAAVCADRFDAERSRAHNDANILVLGAEKLPEAQAKRVVEAWLKTPFESGGRHERRVRQIEAIEQQLVPYRVARANRGTFSIFASANRERKRKTSRRE